MPESTYIEDLQQLEEIAMELCNMARVCEKLSERLLRVQYQILERAGQQVKGGSDAALIIPLHRANPKQGRKNET